MAYIQIKFQPFHSMKYFIKFLSIQSRRYCTKFNYMAAFKDTTLFGDPDKTNSGPIKLTTGAPGKKFLQDVNKIIQKSTEVLLAGEYGLSGSSACLQYGPRLGAPLFREPLSKFLTEHYGDKVDHQHLLTTSGATHGLHLTTSLFFRKGDIVFVDDPTYFIALNVLCNDLGLQIVPIPSDNEGMSTSILEKKILEFVRKTDVTEQKPFRAMVYLIPTFHNPTSLIMSADRCRQMIDIAKKERLLLFTDDVYNCLHYDPEIIKPPKRLLAYDEPNGGNVISNGTFSKIMAPGMRTGWLEMAPKLVQLFYDSGILWSAGSSNHYSSLLVGTSINLGLLQKHILNLRNEYKENIQKMNDIIRKETPFVKFEIPKGGYFLWLEMPPEVDGAVVTKLCLEKYNVGILPGTMCSPSGGFKNYIRLSFSNLPCDILCDSTKKVCQAINEVFKNA